ncbi:hypothetical protein D3C80_974660 [compost metagenome]
MAGGPLQGMADVAADLVKALDGLQPVPMGPEGRDVGEQGVVAPGEGEAEIEEAAALARLHQHALPGHGQLAVGQVGTLAGHPVVEGLVALAVQAGEHSRQVAGVGGEGVGNQGRQPLVLPVRPEPGHQGVGEQAAEQGIEQARSQDGEADAIQQVERHQHIEGDEADGGAVVAAHLGEEQEGGQPHDPQLQVQLGEEPEHGHAYQDAGEGAEHPLHQTAPGGAVARLADEQHRQQYPVALVQTERLQDAVTHHQAQRQPQGVAKHHGVRGEVLF